VAWIALYVGIAVAGLAVLAVFAFRLYKQVREFGREVSAAGVKIAALTDELSEIKR
jgi:hypothetical protein